MSDQIPIRIVLPADQFDAIRAELDEPAREIPELAELARRVRADRGIRYSLDEVAGEFGIDLDELR